jgi:hypothetical protein
MEARVILRLCREFHCLPSQLEKEDASIMRLLLIEHMGTRREEGDGEPSSDPGYGG